MLFSNIHWKVLFPAEWEEAWNIKTSFRRRQWHLLVWIDWNQLRNDRKSGTKPLTKNRSDIDLIDDRTSKCRFKLRGERDVIRFYEIRPKIRGQEGLSTQPRYQGSLLSASCSVGRVGENPGNEVAFDGCERVLTIWLPQSQFHFCFFIKPTAQRDQNGETLIFFSASNGNWVHSDVLTILGFSGKFHEWVIM